MKWSRFHSLILLSLIFAGIGFAEDTSREADHQALRALKSGVTEAINKQDMEKLTAFFSKDFVFTTITQEALTSPKALKDYYTRMMLNPESPVKSITVAPEADILTCFIGDSAGYCYGTSEDAYTLRKNGRVICMKSRWTALVVKEEGGWKIKVVHIGADVLNNPILDAASMSLWKKMALGLGIGKYPGEK